MPRPRSRGGGGQSGNALLMQAGMVGGAGLDLSLLVPSWTLIEVTAQLGVAADGCGGAKEDLVLGGLFLLGQVT